jgi:hypothetical protein
MWSPNHPVFNRNGDKIVAALNLLEGDYVWSNELEQIKPILIEVLKRNDDTSILLASILERE